MIGPEPAHVNRYDVVMRTDNGYCGWWCNVHERFTGKRGWCPFCDPSASEGWPS